MECYYLGAPRGVLKQRIWGKACPLHGVLLSYNISSIDRMKWPWTSKGLQTSVWEILFWLVWFISTSLPPVISKLRRPGYQGCSSPFCSVTLPPHIPPLGLPRKVTPAEWPPACLHILSGPWKAILLLLRPAVLLSREKFILCSSPFWFLPPSTLLRPNHFDLHLDTDDSQIYFPGVYLFSVSQTRGYDCLLDVCM